MDNKREVWDSKLSAGIGGVLILLAGCAEKKPEAQTRLKPEASGLISSSRPEDALRKALPTLEKIVTEQNAVLMGFKSRDEAGMVSVDTVLDVYTLDPRRMSEYLSGKKDSILGFRPEKKMYPLTVNGEIRTAITLEAGDASLWFVTGFGKSNRIKLMGNYRRTISDETGLSWSEVFALEYPNLDMLFLGRFQNGNLLLTPVVTQEAHGFRAGVTQDAADVFKTLLSVKNRPFHLDGLPRPK